MASEVINLYAAKSQLSSLVDRAAAGEQIVIAKAGVPLAKLVPLSAQRARREPGGWEGRIEIAEDFDAPLLPDMQQYFDGDET